MTGEYYKSKESVEEYIKLATGINGSQLIEKLKKVLPEHSTLLEIGSGPGSDWKILNEVYKVVGSDNSMEFLNYLKAQNPHGEFIELDAITLETEFQFDGIYSNKVLHHLKDHELTNSIEKQYEILNPRGKICHSFWKGNGFEIFKGMYVNYHDESELKEVFSEYFEILSTTTYKEFEENDSILLIGSKK